MLGSNRDLCSIRASLDCEIETLSRMARYSPDPDRLSRRLSLLLRERRAVSATLANRQAEAANKVVDLSRWFSGNGALYAIVYRATPLSEAARRRRL
jgi:hypothetical protein